jgi:hypothetical protein
MKTEVKRSSDGSIRNESENFLRPERGGLEEWIDSDWFKTWRLLARNQPEENELKGPQFS